MTRTTPPQRFNAFRIKPKNRFPKWLGDAIRQGVIEEWKYDDGSLRLLKIKCKGSQIPVYLGDWILQGPAGSFIVLNNEAFNTLF